MSTRDIAKALWITAPQKVDYRDAAVERHEGFVEVKTLFTGISRGTERLVYQGQVPIEQHGSMRAPFQEGEFNFPVKYGYCAVGEVQNTERKGERVFALFPHQMSFAIPTQAALTLPSDVPSERAVLAANMETALNIVWDAGIGIGDRVVVVGCGVVGLLVGYLAARIPGTDVIAVDIDTSRDSIAKQLGCTFATPDTVSQFIDDDADVLINASANAAGLSLAISLAGTEATIVEASWYGSEPTEVPLGGGFHQRRLQIKSSQVGRLPTKQAARWSFQRRLAKALSLLADPTLDRLISGESAFKNLAAEYHDILYKSSTLCHRVRYEHEQTEE